MHLLYDMWLKNPAQLETVTAWEQVLITAAIASGATVLQHHFHQFSPTGITGFLLLAESHISVHTWPEERLATVDIFTCGTMKPSIILQQLRDEFQPEREILKEIERGTTSVSHYSAKNLPLQSPIRLG